MWRAWAWPCPALSQCHWRTSKTSTSCRAGWIKTGWATGHWTNTLWLWVGKKTCARFHGNLSHGRKHSRGCRQAVTGQIYHTTPTTIPEIQQGQVNRSGQTGHFLQGASKRRYSWCWSSSLVLRRQESRIRRIYFLSARLPPTQAQHRHTAAFP